LPDERRRTRTQGRTHGLDRRHHRRDAAKRQARGNEGDDLAIVKRRIPADDLNRIERGVRIVERRVQRVERSFHDRSRGGDLRT
jgi:hypothetical protein